MSAYRAHIASHASYVRRLNRLERARRAAVISEDWARDAALDLAYRRLVCTHAGI